MYLYICSISVKMDLVCQVYRAAVMNMFTNMKHIRTCCGFWGTQCHITQRKAYHILRARPELDHGCELHVGGWALKF